MTDLEPPRPPGRTAGAAGAALAAALAVVAVAVAVLVAGGSDRGSGPPLGAVLDADDRRALDAVPLRRGAAAPPADPAVDPTDPEAVARRYLAAARSVDADDGGATQLRAAAYAVPGSPPAAVGVVVLDPPPPGQARRASVTALELVAADEADRRRGYRATLATSTIATGPVAGTGAGTGATTTTAATTTTETAYVVLARQPDGRWLVAQDTPGADPDADE